MADHDRDPHEIQAGDEQLFTRRRILRGALVAGTLSLAGLGALYAVTNAPGTVETLTRLDLRWLGLGLLLIPMDLVLGGLRNHVLLVRLHAGTRPGLSLRANLGNVFLGAITPAQVGGGIAQIYVYQHGGVPVTSAAAVTVMTFLTTVAVFVVGGASALYGLQDVISGAIGRGLVRYLIGAVGAAAALFVVALWKPTVAGRLVHRLGIVLGRPSRRLGRRIEGFGRRAIRQLERYHRDVVWFLKAGWLAIGENLLANVALYLVKFTIGWCVVRALGVDAGYWEVVAVQALLLAVVYFAPTPGGSGVAELGAGAFMSLVLPEHLLAPYALLSRVVLVYLQAALGAAVMVRELARPARPRPEGSAMA